MVFYKTYFFYLKLYFYFNIFIKNKKYILINYQVKNTLKNNFYFIIKKTH